MQLLVFDYAQQCIQLLVLDHCAAATQFCTDDCSAAQQAYFCNLSPGWSKACLFLWLVIAQPQCMRALWLMTSQQLCMLTFVADDCSAAMHACFVVVGDCSAATHA